MSEKGKDIREKIEVVVNGKQRGNDLNILSYDHEWEYAVFGDNGIPEDLRCVYTPSTQTHFACTKASWIVSMCINILTIVSEVL